MPRSRIRRVQNLTNRFIQEIKYRKNSEPGQLSFGWEEIPFNRIAAVSLAIQRFESPRYLEIGCSSDITFKAVAVPSERKVGVDPFKGGTIRKTSDEYFRDNGRSNIFDVIFIDGDHDYYQVRKDAINALNCVSANGIVLVHDMLPSNWKEEHIPPISDVSTGNGWKFCLELQQQKEIDWRILQIDHGVLIMKKQRDYFQIPDLSEVISDFRFKQYKESLKTFPLINFSQYSEWLRT